MNRLIYCAILVTAIVSCKKEIQVKETPVLADLTWIVKKLKDSLPVTDYASLDFSKVAYNDSAKLVRVPFQSPHPADHFVAILVDDQKQTIQGKMFDLQPNQLLQLRWLNGEVIKDNIQLYKEPPVQQDPTVELPEVIVVGTYHNNASIDLSILISVIGLIGGPGSSGASGYYSGDPWPHPPQGGGGGGGGLTNPIADPMLLVEQDMGVYKPGIDVKQFLHCFDLIPDAGATCSITLYADIPVDGDPYHIFNWSTGNCGHSFVQLSKQNGTQKTSQFLGFYPETGWKSIVNNSPVTAKMVDDGDHEYNASIRLDLSPAKLAEVLQQVQTLADTKKYDIDLYNCADFALDIFNWSQLFQNQLTVPLIAIPGSPAGPKAISRTPQGLYIKLQELKAAKDARAANIVIPIAINTPNSSGPCN